MSSKILRFRSNKGSNPESSTMPIVTCIIRASNLFSSGFSSSRCLQEAEIKSFYVTANYGYQLVNEAKFVDVILDVISTTNKKWFESFEKPKNRGSRNLVDELEDFVARFSSALRNRLLIKRVGLDFQAERFKLLAIDSVPFRRERQGTPLTFTVEKFMFGQYLHLDPDSCGPQFTVNLCSKDDYLRGGSVLLRLKFRRLNRLIYTCFFRRNGMDRQQLETLSVEIHFWSERITETLWKTENDRR
uniref:Uncharacterized protein n=1 Tax=Romanomermis culicivorax TaxID=13658 RepID=A0A915KR76_ROMCU